MQGLLCVQPRSSGKRQPPPYSLALTPREARLFACHAALASWALDRLSLRPNPLPGFPKRPSSPRTYGSDLTKNRPAKPWWTVSHGLGFGGAPGGGLWCGQNRDGPRDHAADWCAGGRGGAQRVSHDAMGRPHPNLPPIRGRGEGAEGYRRHRRLGHRALHDAHARAKRLSSRAHGHDRVGDLRRNPPRVRENLCPEPAPLRRQTPPRADRHTGPGRRAWLSGD